jgi:RsiW-degrading membrane proteinase PrsW (M82 family)
VTTPTAQGEVTSLGVLDTTHEIGQPQALPVLRRGRLFGLAFAAAVAVLVTVAYEAVRVPLPPLPDPDRDLGGGPFTVVTIGIWLVFVGLGVAVLVRGVRTADPARVLAAAAWVLWSTAFGVLFLGTVLREGFPRGRGIAEPPLLMIPVMTLSLTATAAMSLLVLLGFAVHRLFRTDEASRPRARRLRRVTVAVLLQLPLVLPPLDVLRRNVGELVWCLPTTALALWAVSRMQRHRRMPFRILLVSAGLGGLVAYGFVSIVNHHVATHAPVFLPDSEYYIALLSVVSSVGEEVTKGFAVALVYLFARRWFDGVVAGVVVGAAVGLGFNLVESVQYMSPGGETAVFHHWLRQGVGLAGGHVAFTALTGAGFGAASRLEGGWAKATAVSSGLVTAICAHFASNYVLITGVHNRVLPAAGPALRAMVVLPLLMLVLQGPFVLLYLLVVRRGQRQQGDEVAAGLDAEAAADSGAVTPVEASILGNPPHRFRMRIDALRGSGWATSRSLARLQAVQLDLATARAHPSAGEAETLRARVLALKRTMLDTFADTPHGAVP